MDVEGAGDGAGATGASAAGASSSAAASSSDDSADQPKMNYNMNMAHPLCSTSHFVGMVDRLKEMWKTQQHEMEGLDINNKSDFKHYNDLPLARIKRIMKSDEDVRMISAEAPILFARAAELFILELTIRAWSFSEFNRHTGLEKEDIIQVLQSTDIFDFLYEVLMNPSPALPPAPKVKEDRKK